MVGNEVFFGWQLPTATVCATIGAAASMSPDAKIHLAKCIATPPEYNILSTTLRCRARQSERLKKGRESVWQHSWRSVKAITIKCANRCADCVLTQSADPVNTMLGWNSVPAIRVAMAIRSLWP